MPPWWDVESARFLDECLAHINAARKEKNAVARCRGLFDALNKTWDGFYAYRKRTGEAVAAAQDRSDHADLRDVLLLAVDDSSLTSFCLTGDEIESLALLDPLVLNHDTLRKGEYDPSSITPKLVKDASDEHRQMLNAYRRYKALPDDAALREALLKKTAQLLYIVRSNIAHGEKTSKGPDVKKAQRDKDVCTLVVPVIEAFFQLLFGSPDQRLALYGTLRRGEVNHSLIEDLPGDWIEGKVVGIVSKHNGYPILMWDSAGADIQVEVLVSDRLPSKFDRLDEFEGETYERIWIPVETSSGKQICNIYSGMQA